MQTLSAAKVRQFYPQALLLKPPKGSRLDYQKLAYQRYLKSDRLIFPVSRQNDQVARKSWVYGLVIGENAIAYQLDYVKKFAPIIESVGNVTVKVEVSETGKVTATNKKTGTKLAITELYWFAWYAFHPQTQLRKLAGSGE